ncbi:MAG: indolepyruvate ferredoxin oxidoreductase family protein, partial [Pseudomonadota bacterium]
KGPGVDRSGDVFRHANHAGSSKHGGVIALMGDDHTCESSTSAHQSEFAFVDAMMPVLNPAGVQELLDFGLYGLALSRFAGVWVGIKCVKDNIESTATVDGRIDRVQPVLPDDFTMPPGGLNIRLGDQALDKEARLHRYKRDAILAFTRANKLDRTVFSGGQAPRIGIISSGKSYLDARQALEDLGIDEVKASQLGIRLYKVAMTWPLEPQGLAAFADGLDLIIVVEEKRSLIETQIKEQLYGRADAPAVIGKKDENEQPLFRAEGALDPVDVAVAVGERLVRFGAGDDVKAALSTLKRVSGNESDIKEVFSRTPYFCSGCPHNSSTVVPEGSRAYAGIGCHYMAQWMDRETEGFTQMGGEGVNWIGEAPFSKREHVFQNLGDGTYIHSGSLAVRAAVAAGTNITFKILYNDAVAMTGGQSLDGGLSVPQIVQQLRAEGVERVVVVSDEPDKYPLNAGIPRNVTIHHRRELQTVQKELAAIPGVTALVYDQTCAAEKRRRRKRGLFPDPDRRIFINEAVCEGCGDCGIKSNCVSVIPKETDFGRKRAIDQSSCNKDFSCVEGFCPSFVSVAGARIRKKAGVAGGATKEAPPALAALPAPKLPATDDVYTMLVTGVGGTGVVTISAVLGQAAHIEGKAFGSIDMTGLAQKGGAVACHMRFADKAAQIHAIRAGRASADLILGCDLVTTASAKVLDTVRQGHTAVTVNTHEMITGDFTRDPTLQVPGNALLQAIETSTGEGKVVALDANAYALTLFGDSIMSNMFMLGYAYQQGLVPIGAEAIREAIALNGAAVARNQEAFEYGRLAAHDRAALDAVAGGSKRADGDDEPAPLTLDEMIEKRTTFLTAYQDSALADRYRAKVEWVARMERERAASRTGLAEIVAQAYFKLLAYKDEYEVARLYTDGRFEAALCEAFEGDLKVSFHMAPPLLSRKNKATGEPRKMRLGPWLKPMLRVLSKGKRLRGTRWDVFGWTEERKLERRMITDYETLLDEMIAKLNPKTHGTLCALAGTPLSVKGFGPVKERHYVKAKAHEKTLLEELRNPTPTAPMREAAE